MRYSQETPDSRELISKVFEHHGAEVIEASSAREALERLDHHSPECVVSDIGMAGEDGYSLMRSIRAKAGSSGKVPAIALTAYARDEDRASALAAGFHIHMPKPIDPSALVSSVTQLVHRKLAAN